jgi:hypothetical protein
MKKYNGFCKLRSEFKKRFFRPLDIPVGAAATLDVYIKKTGNI